METIMGRDKKTECQVFDGERIVLAIPSRRRGIYVRIRTVAVICFLIIAAVYVCARNGVLDNWTLLGRSDDSEQSGGDRHEITKAVDSESDTEGAEESIDTETHSEETHESSRIESEGIIEEEAEASDVIDVDLSRAEKGDGYIVNYTGLSIDTEGIFEIGFFGGKQNYSEHPTVMILHTHTSEGYYDLCADEPLHTVTKSVVAVGERIAYILNDNGVPTVHCTVIHDGEGDPYENAAETIRAMLDIFPTVEYIIDLHRLSEYDDLGRAVRTESALGSAQVRLTVSSEGILTRDSLALAMLLRSKLNRGDRRLCLPVVFTDSEYNSTATPYYLKLDVGAVGNSTQEAIAAGELFAEALIELLKK